MLPAVMQRVALHAAAVTLLEGLLHVSGLMLRSRAWCLQKYRLYLKRVSGVSPSQGRRGLGTQPEWPPMMGPTMGMGMGSPHSPMGPMPPVSHPDRE